jgi:acyl carrier protein
MARPDLPTAFAAPRTLIEETLASIWAEVLGLTSVGTHDHFVDLGGHSVAAAQVASRVGDTLHVEVPLRELFEASTIADMAVVIMQHQASQIDKQDLAQLVAEIEAVPEAEVAQRIRDESDKRED